MIVHLVAGPAPRPRKFRPQATASVPESAAAAGEPMPPRFAAIDFGRPLDGCFDLRASILSCAPKAIEVGRVRI